MKTSTQSRRITYIDKQSIPHTFVVADGSNLLDIAQAHDLEMEGACGGSCACSTCHVIVTDTNFCAKPGAPLTADDIGHDGVSGTEPAEDLGPPEEFYDRIPEPSDDENDMLDLAFGLTETSRLGCQIVMCKELDGLTVRLPGMTRNLQASDFDGGGGSGSGDGGGGGV
ncbi:MAG: hypothetical protein M1831_002398 [Alyxoria varia]|nr:MAG: hypothetical protein M1831_002398 [Alyxoria varia]